MKMIFLFIDGFGLGEKDSGKNPVYAADAPNINHILNKFCVMPTDTSMGVPGIPQSATGQTAIFTGVNAPGILGTHLSGFPTDTLKSVIDRRNILKELTGLGYKVINANVYREEYLSRMLDPKARECRPSVTSVVTMSCGCGFITVKDYKCGKGVYHDITGHMLIKSGCDVQPITPEEAALRLYAISRGYDFTLFEHFLTDIIGHTADMELSIKQIELLDAFLGELIRLIDFNEDILFITSDHGNIEDITTGMHTMNKVPTVIAGRIPGNVPVEVESLTDIMPAVLKIFNAIV